MTAVETIQGPIPLDEVGATLMHEHVFVLSPEFVDNYGEYWDEEAEIAAAVDKLNELAGRGIATIVDPTVVGLGRYIPRVQRVAEQVTLNIVAATGVYTYNDVPLYLHFRGPGTAVEGPEPMDTMFVRDITDGIADTGVKAAILKCATDVGGMTPGVERVLRACARAHRETGVPITTHTDAATFRGRDQQKIFREEGVDLERVVIGHCGDSTDLDYLTELMDNGSTIGMDRFGLDILLPHDERVGTVASLCERGYAERMVLAHDAACFIDWFDADLIPVMAPNWHFNHISDDVLPALLAAGVTQAQVDQMLVDNPKRIFDHAGGY